MAHKTSAAAALAVAVRATAAAGARSGAAGPWDAVPELYPTPAGAESVPELVLRSESAVKAYSAPAPLPTDPVEAVCELHRLGDCAAARRAAGSAAGRLLQCTEPLSPEELGACLFGSRVLRGPEVERLRGAVAQRLPPVTGARAAAKTICLAACGLQGADPSATTEALLSCIAGLVSGGLADVLDSRGIGALLFGLQRQGPSVGARRLLVAVAPLVAEHSGPLTPQSTGSALHGLRGMSDEPESQMILQALAKVLGRGSSAEGWRCATPDAVAMALYGLCRQEASPAARAVLRSLAPLIATFVRGGGWLDAKNAAAALHGMQGQSSSTEARAVLLQLARAVRAAPEPFDGAAVGGVLFGLQSQEDSKEVRALLLAAVPRIETCSTQLTPKNFANALYGLQHLGGGSAERRVLGALAALASSASASEPWGTQAVANALYGLRSMRDSHETRRVLATVAAHIGRAFNATHFAMALYGLRGQTWSPEARSVVAALAAAAELLTAPLEGRQLTMTMLGLQEQASTTETRRLLRGIVRLIPAAESCEPLRTQDAGAVIYGLRNQRDRAEARAALGAFVPLLVASSGTVAPQTVSLVLYGAHNQADDVPARALLAAFPAWAARCKDPLGGRQLAGALYGMRERGDTPEARRVFAALVPMLEDEPIGAENAALALYGLRAQRPTPELDELLCRMVPLVAADPSPWPPACIGKALYGLQGLSGSPALLPVLHMLGDRLRSASGNIPQHAAAASLQGLLALGRGGAPVAPIIADLVQRVSQGEVRGGPGNSAPLAQMLAMSGAPVPAEVSAAVAARNTRHPVNAVERALRLLFTRCGVPGLRFNVIHETGFEMDILVGSLNIELDGPSLSYTAEGRKQLMALRAEVLADRGIDVQRVGTERDLAAVVADIERLCRAAAAPTEAGAAAWRRAQQLAAKGWGWARAAVRGTDCPKAAAERDEEPEESTPETTATYTYHVRRRLKSVHLLASDTPLWTGQPKV